MPYLIMDTRNFDFIFTMWAYGDLSAEAIATLHRLWLFKAISVVKCEFLCASVYIYCLQLGTGKEKKWFHVLVESLLETFFLKRSPPSKII